MYFLVMLEFFQSILLVEDFSVEIPQQNMIFPPKSKKHSSNQGKDYESGFFPGGLEGE